MCFSKGQVLFDVVLHDGAGLRSESVTIVAAQPVGDCCELGVGHVVSAGEEHPSSSPSPRPGSRAERRLAALRMRVAEKRILQATIEEAGRWLEGAAGYGTGTSLHDEL